MQSRPLVISDPALQKKLQQTARNWPPTSCKLLILLERNGVWKRVSSASGGNEDCRYLNVLRSHQRLVFASTVLGSWRLVPVPNRNSMAQYLLNIKLLWLQQIIGLGFLGFSTLTYLDHLILQCSMCRWRSSR
jgi:hypothetical protein